MVSEKDSVMRKKTAKDSTCSWIHALLSLSFSWWCLGWVYVGWGVEGGQGSDEARNKEATSVVTLKRRRPSDLTATLMCNVWQGHVDDFG